MRCPSSCCRPTRPWRTRLSPRARFARSAAAISSPRVSIWCAASAVCSAPRWKDWRWLRSALRRTSPTASGRSPPKSWHDAYCLALSTRRAGKRRPLSARLLAGEKARAVRGRLGGGESPEILRRADAVRGHGQRVAGLADLARGELARRNRFLVGEPRHVIPESDVGPALACAFEVIDHLALISHDRVAVALREEAVGGIAADVAQHHQLSLEADRLLGLEIRIGETVPFPS